jgi:hypothetical protein
MKPHWNLKHGMCATRIYKLWAEMRARCEKQDHPVWADYGGRGIKVCDRWASFDVFYEEFGRLRTSGTSIDRIDNDRGYEPGNVRWATRLEQGRNKRNNARYTAFGESKTVAEWAEDARCVLDKPDSIKSRIYRGWSVERAITEPPSDRGQNLAKERAERAVERRLFTELRIAA